MDPREYLNDDEEAQRLALDGRQSTIWTAIPCIVQSVDLTKMTLTAVPAIQGRFEDQQGNVQYTDMPTLLDVPICFPNGGGFIITFPIMEGDEVLVVFASRCIDSWWQNGGYSNKPMEFRMHDLSDGFAIPGPRSQPNTVSAISDSDLQIRNEAGTTYLSITAAGTIKLFSPTEIDLTAPSIVMTGDVSVVGDMQIAGAMTFTGVLNVTGAITATSVTAATITSAGKVLSTHVHTGVTTGTGDTGPPL